MVDVVLWLIAVQAIALAAFPLCYYLLPGLRDRGASIAMPFGILVVGYASWILSVLRLVPSTQLTALLLALAMAGVSARVFWRNRQEIVEFAKREWPALALAHAVFFVVFTVWALFRSYDPSISHTEQPMDFMFLNSAARSFLGAPEDPWLRGESVSYYYFGYWNFALLTKLTGIASSVTYNLSMALVPAMASMGIFGLVYNLARADRAALRTAGIAATAAAAMLVFLANLGGVLEFMRANGMGSVGFWTWIGVDGLTAPDGGLTETWRPTENWWWWRATRVIGSFDGGIQTDYTIHEFPAFSYVLGDLHPHMMSVPFVALFLAVLWNFWKQPGPVWPARDWRSYLSLFVIAFTLGGLGFTNMWDLPVFAVVFLGVAALKVYQQGATRVWDMVRDAVPLLLAVSVAAFALYSPYFLTFTSQVSGIGAVSGPGTRPFHLFVVWAPYLVAVTPFVVMMFWRTTVTQDWARTASYALAVGFLPFVVWAFLYMNGEGSAGGVLSRFIRVLPLCGLTAIAAYTTLWLMRDGRQSSGTVFTMALATLGLALIMGPELLFVDDSFGGAHERMNTVFKLYYQAWTVLAASTGFVVYYWMKILRESKGHRQLWVRAWGVAFVAVFAGSMYYAPAAMASKAELTGEEATLNGLQHVERFAGGEYRAIEYIRANVGEGSAILEAVGNDYSEYGRIASSTGAPTVLNWPGHQLQWRGSSQIFDGREQDVQTIYQTPDIDAAISLLEKYDIDHVYIGRRERDKYGEDGLGKFAEFMTPIFTDGDVVIYRR